MNEEDTATELAALPRGTIVRRTIRGVDRFYHQWRENGVTKSKYLSPGEILPLRAQLERRKYLEACAKAHKGALTGGGGALAPARFHCDTLTGPFLAEFAAAAHFPHKRDIFAQIRLAGDSPHPGDSPLFLVGPRGTGKTTLLRQLIAALAPTLRAKAAYVHLTGAETAAEVTADLTLLRDLGFRYVFIDDAEHLTGLGGTGLVRIAAGTQVPAALSAAVNAIDISHITFREYARLTGEADLTKWIAGRGGHAGRVTLPETDARLSAAERKELRDAAKAADDFRQLEDAVEDELRFARAHAPVRVARIDLNPTAPTPQHPTAHALVVYDEDELTCELFTVTTDATRTPEQLRYLDDPTQLDAIEHRYGLITERTVLYNGRDARLSSGVAYRNLVKFLLRLGSDRASDQLLGERGEE